MEGSWGTVLENCEEALLLGENWSWSEREYIKHAFDEKFEKRLWAGSLEIVVWRMRIEFYLFDLESKCFRLPSDGNKFPFRIWFPIITTPLY